MKTNLWLIASALCTLLSPTHLEASDTLDRKDTRRAFSYALGMSMARNLKRSGVGSEQVDLTLVERGLRDSIEGRTTLLSERWLHAQ